MNNLLQTRNTCIMEPQKTSRANLENKRLIFMEIGLIISLLVVLLGFKWKSTERNYNASETREYVNIQEEMVPITEHLTKPIPPPPISKAVIINIVDDDIIVEEDIIIDVKVDQETKIEEYIPHDFQEMEEEEEISEEPIFVIVESMPTFPGGMKKLMAYLHNNIKYPTQAKEVGIQGKVFVSFVIETDGSVTDVILLRGIGGGCDEEAIRVISNMPNWIPGKQRNIPVRVRFTLPVSFRLL